MGRASGRERVELSAGAAASGAQVWDLVAGVVAGVWDEDDVTVFVAIRCPGSSSGCEWRAVVCSSVLGAVRTWLFGGSSADWSFHFCPSTCVALFADGRRVESAELYD